MADDSQRTHDLDIYLQEDRFATPKESFQIAADIMEEAGAARAGAHWADIGCATGEFIHYGVGRFPGIHAFGVDVVPQFFPVARERTPDATFIEGSVTDVGALPPQSQDAVTLIGVLGIFDDFRPVLGNLIEWVRPGGVVVVYGLFNPYPLDVWIKYRPADEPASDLEAGWNIFSEASVAGYLDAHPRVATHEFRYHWMGLDLVPHPTDPVRTWTMKDETGRRHLRNGLAILEPKQFLSIRLI